MPFWLVNRLLWLHCVVQGILIAAAFAVAGHLTEGNVSPAYPVVAGLFAGVIGGWRRWTLLQGELAATGENLAPAEKVVVVRATHLWGPVPADARLRQAAAAALTQRRSTMEEQFALSLIIIGALTLAFAVLAVATSPGLLWFVLLLAGADGIVAITPRRYARRIRKLEAGTAQGNGRDHG